MSRISFGRADPLTRAKNYISLQFMSLGRNARKSALDKDRADHFERTRCRFEWDVDLLRRRVNGRIPRVAPENVQTDLLIVQSLKSRQLRVGNSSGEKKKRPVAETDL
jgi:hypothetical protein